MNAASEPKSQSVSTTLLQVDEANKMLSEEGEDSSENITSTRSDLYPVVISRPNNQKDDDIAIFMHMTSIDQKEERQQQSKSPLKSPPLHKTSISLYSDPSPAANRRERRDDDSSIVSSTMASEYARSPILLKRMTKLKLYSDPTPQKKKIDDDSSPCVHANTGLDNDSFLSYAEVDLESSKQALEQDETSSSSYNMKSPPCNHPYRLSPLLNQHAFINIGENVATPQKSLGRDILQNIVNDLLEQNQHLSQEVEGLTAQLHHQREQDNKLSPARPKDAMIISTLLNQSTVLVSKNTLPGESTSQTSSTCNLPSHEARCLVPIVAPTTHCEITIGDSDESNQSFDGSIHGPLHELKEEAAIVTALQSQVRDLKQQIQRLQSRNTKQEETIDALKRKVASVDRSFDILNSLFDHTAASIAEGENIGLLGGDESSCIGVRLLFEQQSESFSAATSFSLPVKEDYEEESTSSCSTIHIATSNETANRFQYFVSSLQKRYSQAGHAVEEDAPPDNDLDDILNLAAQLYHAECLKDRGDLVLQWEEP